MVRQVNSPQTHCDQTRDRYEFLLGLEDSKRDNTECASLLSDKAKARTTRFTSGINKASPYSVR